MEVFGDPFQVMRPLRGRRRRDVRERCLLRAVRPPAPGPDARRGAARLVPRLPLRQYCPPRQAQRRRPRLLPLPDLRPHLQPPRKPAQACRLLTQQASSPRRERIEVGVTHHPSRSSLRPRPMSSKCFSKCPVQMLQQMSSISVQHECRAQFSSNQLRKDHGMQQIPDRFRQKNASPTGSERSSPTSPPPTRSPRAPGEPTSAAPLSTGGWKTTTSAPSSAASAQKWPTSHRPRYRDSCSRQPPPLTRPSTATSPPCSSAQPSARSTLALKVRYGLNLERRLNRIDDALSMLRKEAAGPGW